MIIHTPRTTFKGHNYACQLCIFPSSFLFFLVVLLCNLFFFPLSSCHSNSVSSLHHSSLHHSQFYYLTSHTHVTFLAYRSGLCLFLPEEAQRKNIAVQSFTDYEGGCAALVNYHAHIVSHFVLYGLTGRCHGAIFLNVCMDVLVMPYFVPLGSQEVMS